MGTRMPSRRAAVEIDPLPRDTIAGPNTWHGFDKRPIKGVRRLMEINYVRDWRDSEQLAFPGQPVC